MDDRAEKQAQSQFESIQEMLAAVNVDYARLEELKDEREALQEAVWQACEVFDEAYAAYREDADGDGQVQEDMQEACDALEEAEEELFQFGRDYGEELADLIKDAGDCESEEDARERIQEDPLSVQVRSCWCSPGEEMKACEFEILLCTGGPAVRIRGELDQFNEPYRAWLEYQDWGTPWQRYFDEDTGCALVEYASHFYFGE